MTTDPTVSNLRKQGAVRPAVASELSDPLVGNIDLCDCRRVVGWAHDGERPGQPVRLAILVDGRLVARISADAYRADVEAAGHGLGRHGFDFSFLPALDPTIKHTIEARRSVDGALIGMVRLAEAHGPLQVVAADHVRREPDTSPEWGSTGQP